ncbi:MAG: T9SS type A sorting domain-containing protein [Bacteroidales bacterium]|nr:T9SS type A sorting domain-containing protein [Bacteroidales bacterium]
MVRRWLILLLALSSLTLSAQEVLVPLQRRALPLTQRPHKAQPAAVSLPFFDDFATGTLDATRWQTPSGAAVTDDVSPLAPTVGVATLDALDADGRLYPQATTSLFPADTLLSQPIVLDSLTPADSVVFSFHYLPGGGYGNMWERVGECPDPQDSLFLDFYRPQDSTWVTVWSRGGISVDTLMEHTGTAWQYVALPVADSAYFHTSADSLHRFCFRFRSYASLESSPKAGKPGNGDYWHLDCVHLDRGRDIAAGPAVRDVAFAAPAPSMLRLYRAMPFRHYSASDMADALEMKIANRYTSPLASHYAYAVYDTLGNGLHSYDGGFENAPPQALQTIAAHARPAVEFAFPPMTEATDYLVVHTVREGTGGDAFPLNDTVRFRQRFADYYAYDDGSPENGYGLTSTAARLYLAYRFDLSAADTLAAVDLYFNCTLDSGNTAIPFYLTLWSVGDDGRPAEVLYCDENRRLPRYASDAEPTGFVRYPLEAPVVVDGQVFVGFEQLGNDYLNLGFDRSMNTSDRIWYLTGTEWQQSILSGSLMLRPAFGTAATAAVGTPQAMCSKVWPNPASEWVTVEGIPEGSRVELYDMQGRKVLATHSRQLATAGLPAGLYLIRMLTPDGDSHTAKLIVKH